MAAGNVQLKLQVSLDTAFLRSQLRTLASNIGNIEEFSVIPRLDTNELKKELGKLDKDIRININDSQVEAARARIGKLNKTIATLRRASSQPIKVDIKTNLVSSATQKDVRKTRKELSDKLQEGGKLTLKATVVPGTSQKEIAQLRRDISSKIKNVYIGIKGQARRIDQEEIQKVQNQLVNKKVFIPIEIGRLDQSQIAIIKGEIDDTKAFISTFVKFDASQIKEIQDKIDDKKVFIPVDIKADVTEIKEIQDQLNDKKVFVPVGIKPDITPTEINEFKTKVESLLKGIVIDIEAKINVARQQTGGSLSQEEIIAKAQKGVVAIAEMQRQRYSQDYPGETSVNVTESGRREQLRKAIEQLTIPKLIEVAEELGVKNIKSSRLNKSAKIDKIVEEALIERVKAFLDPQAMMRGGAGREFSNYLDTFARGLFKLLGLDASAIKEQMQARRRLAPVDWPAQVPYIRPSIGPSASGRALPGAPGPTGFISGTQTAGLLPSRVFASLNREIVAAIRSALQVPEFSRSGALTRYEPPTRRTLDVDEVEIRDVTTQTNNVQRAIKELWDETFREIKDVDVAKAFNNELIEKAIRDLGRALTSKLIQARSELVKSVRVTDLGQTLRALPAGRSRPALPPGQRGGDLIPYRGPIRALPPAGIQRALPPGRQGETLARYGAFAGPSSRINPQRQLALQKVGSAFGGTGRAIGGLDKFFKQSRLPLSGAINELTGEFANATKQVLLYGTAYKGLAFITSLPGQALEAAKGLQTYRNQLGAVSKTTAETEANFEFVQGLAKRFNVPLESARKGFVRMYAAMEPANIEPDTIKNLFEGVSKASATFGLSADEVQRVTNAFAQMASKGQIMAEEVKGQLGDVLPGAMALMADAANMSIQEFVVAMEKGQLKGKAMEQIFFNLGIVMEDKFGESAENASKTIQGAMNAISNATQLAYEAFEPLVSLAAENIFPLIASAIDDARVAIEAFVSSVTNGGESANVLTQNQEDLLKALEAVADVATATWEVFKELGPTLLDIAKITLDVVAGFVNLVNTPIGREIAKWTVIVLALNTAMVTLTKLGVLALIGKLALLVKAVILGAIKWKTYLAGLQSILATIPSVVGGLVSLKLALASVVGAAVLGGLYVLWKRFSDIGSKLKEIGTNAENTRRKLSAMADEGDVAGLQSAAAIEGRKALDINEAKKIFAKGGLLNEEQQDLFKSLGLEDKLYKQRDFSGRVGQGLAYETGEALEEMAKQQNETIVTLNNSLEKARAKAAESSNALTMEDKVEIDLGAGTDSGATAKKENLTAYYNLEDRLAANFTAEEIARQQEMFQRRLDMVNAEYDLKEARANKFQKDAIALARKLENIELNRQKAILDASLDLYRQTRSTAEGRASMGTTSSLGQSTPQSAPTGDRGIIERLTGDPSSPYYRADHGGDNYHEHLAFATVAARDAAIEALERTGIRVGSTYREGDPGYHGANLALDVPASQVPLGQEVRMSRDVEQALSEAGFTGFGIGGPQSQVLGPPRQIDSNEARNIEQTQQAKFSEESLKRTIEYSKEKAEIERRNAIETAEAQLFNLENLKLEVELAEEKNSLISSGLNDEEIQLQLELLELREKSTNLLEVIKKDMIANGKTQEEMNLKVEEHNLELQESIRYQKELNERKKETKFLSEIRALDQRQNLAFAFTPGEERRRQLEQEYTPEQADTIASREEEIMRIEELRDKFRGIAQSIGDSFGEAFKNIIAGSGSVRENLSNMFQSIADSFADMAAQMIAEAVKMQAMKAMQGLFSFFAPGSSIIGGGAAAGGSLLGSLSQSAASGLGGLGGFAGPSAIPWGFADGGIMTDKGPMPLKLYASGGIANSPQLAVFGEGSTPEAFVPLPDGRSIPVKFTGDGGMKDSSGGDVIVNVQVDANDSKVSGNAQEGNQLGKVIAGAVQSEIIKQKRPGGLLSE